MLATTAYAQYKPVGLVSMHFEPTIAEFDPDEHNLADFLSQNTPLDAAYSAKGTRIQFVYGIGNQENISGPYVSDEVILVPGEPATIQRGDGPVELSTPWEAFTDPLVGFGDPPVSFGDPVDGSVVDFADPLAGLNAIWGTGGTYTDVDDPDEYAIVLFSMTAMPDANVNNLSIQHKYHVAPFRIGSDGSPAAKRESTVPDRVTLEAAYPNPFNPQTTIRYALPEAADVRLAVYDLMGREMAVLAEGVQPAGTHQATFDAAGLPSGVYLYRLQAGTHTETHRMTLLK